MADYEPGKMDIESQKETYEIFWAWSVRVSVICVILLMIVWAAFG